MVRGDATRAATKSDGVVALAGIEVVATGFTEPAALAIEPDGAIFVTDRARGTVTRIRSAGDRAGDRAVLLDHLHQPRGVAVDAAGNILVVETAARRILRLGPDGQTTVMASGLRQPRCIAVGPDGGVWISMRRSEPSADDDGDVEGDDGEWVVARLDESSEPIVVAPGFAEVQALTVTAAAVYVATADRGYGRDRPRATIVRIPLPYNGRTIVDRAASDAIRQPSGIAIDGTGDLVISGAGEADKADADVLLKRHRNGQVTLLAAGLQNPIAIAFAPSGDLLVLEKKHGGRVLRLRAPPAPVPVAPPFTNESPIRIGGRAGAGHRVEVFETNSPHPVATTVAGAANGIFTIDVPVASNVPTQLSFIATSAAGLGLASAPARVRILHDDHLPHVAMADPAAGAYVNALVGLRAHAEDLESGVAAIGFMLDDHLLARIETDRPTEPFTTTYPLDTRQLSEGPHTLTAVATDRAGNHATVAQLLTVDRTPPETSIVNSPPSETAGETLAYTVAALDQQSPVVSFSWRLDGGAWSPYDVSPTIQVSGVTSGRHVLEVRSSDLAGNEDPTPAARAFTVATLEVRILEPAAHAVVHTNSIWVRGTVVGAGPVAITIALPEELRAMLSIDTLAAVAIAGTFAIEVPVLPGSNTLTVTARAADGATTSDAVTIAVQGPASEPSGLVTVFPPAGFVPHTVQFEVVNLPAGNHSLDLESDGIVDYSGDTLEGQEFVYTRPGMHVAHFRLTTPEGKEFEHRIPVWVYDRVVLEKQLQAVWNGFKEALAKNDAERAAMFIKSEMRTPWLDSLRKFTPEAFRTLREALTEVSIESVHPVRVECEMLRVEGGVTYSYPVRFVMEEDGVWRLSQF